jgi:hypothetical protein
MLSSHEDFNIDPLNETYSTSSLVETTYSVFLTEIIQNECFHFICSSGQTAGMASLLIYI